MRLVLGTALLTAFYMFRLYATTFTGNFRGTHEQEHHLHESPAAMTIPLDHPGYTFCYRWICWYSGIFYAWWRIG